MGVNKRKKSIGGWIFLLLWVAVLIHNNIDENRPQYTPEPIPPPDPAKGMALGWDFNKGDYRYDTSSPSTKGTVRITHKDKVIYTNEYDEFDEDDARDLLDMMGD